MNKKHHEAILAKNMIARKIKEYYDKPTHTRNISRFELSNMLFHLECIQEYIGEGNQPSIDSIMKDETGMI